MVVGLEVETLEIWVIHLEALGLYQLEERMTGTEVMCETGTEVMCETRTLGDYLVCTMLS